MSTLPTPALHAPGRPTSPMGINALSPTSDAVFFTTAKKSAFSPAGSPLTVSPIGTPVGPSTTQNAMQNAFASSSPTPTLPKSPIGASRPVKRTLNEFPFEQLDRPSWGSMGNLPPLYEPSHAPHEESIGSPHTTELPSLGNNSYSQFGGLTSSSGALSARESSTHSPLRSLNISPRHTALPNNLAPNGNIAPSGSEFDYAPRAPAAGNGAGSAGKGSAVSMMKPAPLQRAGSAGGVLMHPSRRPPPPTTSTTPIITAPSPDHTAWPLLTTPTHAGTNSNLTVSGNRSHFGGPAYMNDHEASEEWFDQFGGIEMEPSPNALASHLSNVNINTTPYGPPYDETRAHERHVELPNTRMMNARYLPNQRANFAVTTQYQPHHTYDLESHPTHTSSLASLPTYIQHPNAVALPHLGSSPSPQVVSGSPTSFSLVKHSSRILMIHNFDQLNTDVNTLRALCSTHGGVVRSVAPFPESNAILISFFDLRHAQKAMGNLNSKVLPSGAVLEIQCHFLRDTGVMSKDANQGTLVIFNLDPAITNMELMELFGKYGEIKEIRESPNRKHKFVEFYDVRCAEKAIKALNKTDLHGRKIKIEPSRPGGTSKLDQSSPARRGSIGSGFGTPVYNSTGSPIIPDHSFTHSTPTLPTMTATFISTPPTTTPTTPTSYASFSPAAAPLLSGPNHLPYHTHAQQSSSSAPRYYDPSVNEERNMFTDQPFGTTFNHAPHPIGLPRSNLGNTITVSARRQSASTPDIHSLTMDGNFRFDRSLFDSQPITMTPQTSYSDIQSIYSDSSSTTSLFGMTGNFGSSMETLPLPQDTIQAPVPTPFSENIPGLLLSPNTTPRSPSGSSSGDSSVLEASALGPDDDPSLSGLSSLASASSAQSNGNASDPNGSQLKFDIIISQVLGGFDIRTTLMIKNIPNKYDQDMLLLAVNKRHQGTYDFFYLPIDFKNRCNVGYAFINFIDPKNIPAFCEEFDNKKWEKFNSEKVCRISYARIQGKLAMIEHFKNSSLMFEDPKCRPLIFHSDGTSVGKPEPFPVGPNVRPRARKDSAAGSQNPPTVASSATIPTPPSVRGYKLKKDKLVPSLSPSRGLQD